ncbi:unnamed protein product [Rotaria sp. Silwood2]|nr:unnamed protein product [Rotaria sp. Silwood2]CAF4279619.1 unnamed protein product [Rotaria sp. Silwood2]
MPLNLWYIYKYAKANVASPLQNASLRLMHALTPTITSSDKQQTATTKQLESTTNETRFHREPENLVENDIDRLKEKREDFIRNDTNKSIIIDNNQIDWNRLIYILEEQQNYDYFALKV